MISEGIKTTASDRMVSSMFVDSHILIGIESLQQLIESNQSIKHMRF